MGMGRNHLHGDEILVMDDAAFVGGARITKPLEFRIQRTTQHVLALQ